MLPVLLQVEAESARVAGIGVGLFVFITAIAVALVVIAAGQFTQSKAYVSALLLLLFDRRIC